MIRRLLAWLLDPPWPAAEFAGLPGVVIQSEPKKDQTYGRYHDADPSVRICPAYGYLCRCYDAKRPGFTCPNADT